MLLLCNAAWSITFSNKSQQVNDIRLVKLDLARTKRHDITKHKKYAIMSIKPQSNTHKHDLGTSIFNLTRSLIGVCGACVTSFVATLLLVDCWKLIWPQLVAVAVEAFVLTQTLRLNYTTYSLVTLARRWMRWIGDDRDFGQSGHTLPFFVQLLSWQLFWLPAVDQWIRNSQHSLLAMLFSAGKWKSFGAKSAAECI